MTIQFGVSCDLQREMERFLPGQGCVVRRAMFRLFFAVICYGITIMSRSGRKGCVGVSRRLAVSRKSHEKAILLHISPLSNKWQVLTETG